jgi:hypothetical protein
LDLLEACWVKSDAEQFKIAAWFGLGAGALTPNYRHSVYTGTVDYHEGVGG